MRLRASRSSRSPSISPSRSGRAKGRSVHPGLLFNRDIYESGSGDKNTLLVTLGGVDLNIAREPNEGTDEVEVPGA